MVEQEFKVIREEWKEFYGHKDNFTCELSNDGWWSEDKCYGKWLFHIKSKENKCFINGESKIKDVPTYEDQLNMIGAMLECEKRNDYWRLTHTNNIKAKTQVGRLLNSIKKHIKLKEATNGQSILI